MCNIDVSIFEGMWSGGIALLETVGADVKQALFLQWLVKEIMLMASICLLADLIRSMKRSTKCVTRSG